MVVILDFLNSLIQAVLLGGLPYYFFIKGENTKPQKLKLFLSVFLIFLNLILLTKYMNHSSFWFIGMNVISLIIIRLIYNKFEFKDISVGYAIIYYLFIITSLVISNFNWAFVGIVKNQEMFTVLTIYVPVMILEFFIFINRDNLYKFYRNVVHKRFSYVGSIIIITTCDILLSYSFIFHGKDVVSLRYSLILISFAIFVSYCFLLKKYGFIIRNIKRRIGESSERFNSNSDVKKRIIKYFDDDKQFEFCMSNSNSVEKVFFENQEYNTLKDLVTNLKLKSSCFIFIGEYADLSSVGLDILSPILKVIFLTANKIIKYPNFVSIDSYKIFKSYYLDITLFNPLESDFNFKLIHDLVMRNNGNLKIISMENQIVLKIKLKQKKTRN